MTYQSAFSYNLTKQYPYRWFTWVVVLGGIAATVLFSAVNVAANGTIYVVNPNDTERIQKSAWHQKPPWSLVSKVNPFCQDQIILVGTELRTSNARLNYRIVEINPVTSDRWQTNTSFTYHNDEIHGCNVTSMLFNWSGVPTPVDIRIHCLVYSGQIPMNLSIQYASDLPVIYPMGTVDKDTKPALWWAEYLRTKLLDIIALSLNSMEIKSDVAYLQSSPEHLLIGMSGKGTKDGKDFEHWYFHNTSSPDTLQQWSSAFGLDIPLSYNGTLPGTSTKLEEMRSSPLHLENSTISSEVASLIHYDSLIKVYYSWILTDLGQNVDTNMFAHKNGVFEFFNASRQYLLKKSPEDVKKGSAACSFIRDPKDFNYCNFTFHGPKQQSVFDFYKWAGTGEPEVGPAYFNAQYACQVPKLKPIGSLMVSVIVGNLVMLQALWVMFNWAVKLFLERHDSKTNCCTDCTDARAFLGYQPANQTPGPSPGKPLDGSPFEAPQPYQKATIPLFARRHGVSWSRSGRGGGLNLSVPSLVEPRSTFI